MDTHRTHLVVTAAQLAALNGTPLQLVSASGLSTGSCWDVVRAFVFYTPNTTKFTLTGSPDFWIKYGTTAVNASGYLPAAGIVDQTVLSGGVLLPATGLVVPNAALMLALNGGSLSLGDGTLMVKLEYRDPRMSVLDDDF